MSTMKCSPRAVGIAISGGVERHVTQILDARCLRHLNPDQIILFKMPDADLYEAIQDAVRLSDHHLPVVFPASSL